MTIDYPLVFCGLMGLAILLYVVLDGYDLGVGMLMPAAAPPEQDVMVASIGPFWDANETWLVLGIGILLVAFPAAHGLILGALYLPVAGMLIGLMLRGVAFEFRIKAEGWHRELWNWLFWFGSFVASFAQGYMLGRTITGFLRAFCRSCSACSSVQASAAVTCSWAPVGWCCAPTARCNARRSRGHAGACCGSGSACCWCRWRPRSRATPYATSGSTFRARSR
jgi:cytochrome d ubiquinol oxidase subunit II